MSSSSSFLVDTAVPTVGVLVSCCLYGASVPSCLRARKTGILEHDPTTVATTLINVLVWILYASMLGNIFVFTGSFFGTVCNAFNVAVALPLARKEVRPRLEMILTAGMFLIAFCIMFVACSTPFVEVDFETRKTFMSLVCVVVCLIMFASPLTQGWEALKMMDGQRINVLLTSAQIGNGLLWSTYGVGLGDPAIIYPNAVSVLIAVAVLLIKAYVTARNAAKAPKTEVVSLPSEFLADAVAKGTFVVLRSFGSENCLFVDDDETATTVSTKSPEEELDLEKQEISEAHSYVRGAPIGARAIQLVRAGNESEVSLRLSNGRFLALRITNADEVAALQVEPRMMMVSVQCETPGPEGRFILVESKSAGQDTVSFYNASMQIFLRCSMNGVFDASPRCDMKANEEHPTSRFALEALVVEPAAEKDASLVHL
mmetsp:Transcript_99382/g.207027  ORF Transcript_99382/g.207027 Transcript_99382/m.207027 type:complete len:429 (+) Transcript_99382:191-1477(+)|eukprot:CAMPEP_0206460468 /NCGR_PEP_ID=MMETSP0324_2-20121206/24768_1 /ASSEMBLY_ACC=CAM_ASM_000836 /TAXON_ID=2866 /ORGANISM="Crypthecodinium cohnii, Strain Seligo" /LENGTH=428 /DNA_ID=CAMNT_0053932173 /DNA_START=97 /DNA_END=1383 /DNA_ORIENTATION=-